MRRLLLLPFIIIAIYGCEKTEKQDGIPECITDKIKNLDESGNYRFTKVNEFVFQNKTVYVLVAGNLDEVIDCDCNNIGLLGGFAGNMEVNGEDFSNAVFVRTVWEK